MEHRMLITFRKNTDLVRWMDSTDRFERCSPEMLERYRNHYAQVRNVSMVIQVRVLNEQILCRIKCPINPLPVKGWFEVPTIPVLKRFLRDQGWEEVQTITPNLLDFDA